jgi:hypothetical protein
MKKSLRILGAIGLMLASFFATSFVFDYFQAKSPLVVSLIKIEQATYGGNCGPRVKAGNATEFLSKSCDGRPSCNLRISVQELGDPAQGCGKDFSALFLCDPQGPARRRHVPGEANGSTLVLDCKQAN